MRKQFFPYHFLMINNRCSLSNIIVGKYSIVGVIKYKRPIFSGINYYIFPISTYWFD